jgi:germination protein M
MKNKNNKTSIGCLFWLALVLFIIVIFLFNQKNIEEIIRRTGFLDVFSNNDEPVEVTIIPEDEPEDSTSPEDTSDDNNIVVIPEDDSPVDDEPDIINEPENTDQPEENNTEDHPQETTRKPNLRNAKIYFVKVNNDSTITLTGIIRPVYYDDSPLKETLLTLLSGQTTTEINQGLLTMIPDGTELVNVYVRENTAFIDFSDDFSFNKLGNEGLHAQLKQVVYTATEFNNISNVQILINGQIKEYLSSEGIYIGEPLSRDSF